MAQVDIDMTGFKEFFEQLERQAQGELRKEMETFLEGIGEEFLRLVEEQIIQRKVMDSRNLLTSFHKSADGNVWELEEDGLVLEVGSSVEYAGYVNDGHWTNTKGVAMRFVPGYWEGEGENSKFIYDPDAEGGMVLKQHWVEGKHYFDAALRAIDGSLTKICEAKLQQWINKYFG